MIACPQAEVQMSTYAIDRYPVTLERYRDCRANGPCFGWAANERETRANAPAQVNHQDAEAFCRWVGRRLPTDAMTEKALRGPAPRTDEYPWTGDYCDGNPRPGCDGNGDFPYPLGAFPADRGWYPIESIGHLRFWTSERFDSDYYADPASFTDPEIAGVGRDISTRHVTRIEPVWAREPRMLFENNYFRCARYVQP